MSAMPSPYRRPGYLHVGRNYEHEVFLLAASAFLGVAYLFGAPRPGSVQAVLPGWMSIAWALVLLVSGVLGLLGCYWPKRMDVALEIERSALTLQAAGMILFAAAVWSFAGLSGLATGIIVLAWALANLRRVYKISIGLTDAERAIHAEGNGNTRQADDDSTESGQVP
jgi:hypothetical protein